MKRFFYLVLAALLLVVFLSPLPGQEGRKEPRGGRGERRRGRREQSLPADVAALEKLSVILGCPTDKSVAVSILSKDSMKGYLEYGTETGKYPNKTDEMDVSAVTPLTIALERLKPDTRYFYRLRYRKSGEDAFAEGGEYSFHTQRAPGSKFTFEIQGDSHPERPQQFASELYAILLRGVAANGPDFYVTMGDDFSVDKLQTVNADTVKEVYLCQRPFLALAAHSSPLFLVNGNHEQAAACNLDGTANNVAVWAQTTRNKLFPQPAPDGFYTGDEKPVKFIGKLCDYYAWTWGDALFVVIDPYWHSPKPVDNVLGGREKVRDMWAITLGEDQYKWLKETLEQSTAKFKFVFCHHVLGTGRGGIEMADQYEWGGRNKKGVWEFDQKRPGWKMPIHQLMAKNKVTIFFQGHDHIFVKQEKDGVIYQTLPEPADPNYALYNKDAFPSGDALPNSGRVRVTVSPEKVTVDYIHSCLPGDETEKRKNGKVSYSYTVAAPTGNKQDDIKQEQAPPAESTIDPGTKPTEVSSDFQFTEGPAVDKEGNVFFSDVQANRIYRMSLDGKITVFRENTGGANGLAFDGRGNLVVCEGGNGRLVSIDSEGKVTVLADKYEGKRFNQPNDLWIDPKGGVYFSDPVYSRGVKVQDGEHVYYVSPDRKKVTRVISDMVRPNGLVGTPDGKTLYVADHGGKKTYRYSISEDGALRDKTLFVSKGSDGMTMDSKGNVYITDDAVFIVSPAGKEIGKIEVPKRPTNLCFCGKDGRTLLITARASVYTIHANTKGVSVPQKEKAEAPAREEEQEGEFKTDVPEHPLDVILARPTAKSVTLCLLFCDDAGAYVAYGTEKTKLDARTKAVQFKKGEPTQVLLNQLKPDTRYYYQVRSADENKNLLPEDVTGTFHTQRPSGGKFAFAVQADSHLDEKCSPDLYRRTLGNELADSPDFLVDLGDTFMTGKHNGRKEAAEQYLAQRYYMSLVGYSTPVFLALGNHDGEESKLYDGTADCLPVWSNAMRKRYFPNPVPDDFYSGNPSKDKFAGLLENYYSWQWGDALFVILDPYWHSARRRGGRDNWAASLGKKQYDWLKKTLEDSKASFKFLFIHQLVGGRDSQGRGGAEAASFYEWGGKNGDGSEGFEKNRPGWEMPVHKLLVKHKVNIVFHGHDHFFAQQEKDGVVYQLVPQPGHENYKRVSTAEEYGYKQGVILPNSGHLRVTVSPEKVAVEYVRAYLPEDRTGGKKNGEVACSYEITEKGEIRILHKSEEPVSKPRKEGKPARRRQRDR